MQDNLSKLKMAPKTAVSLPRKLNNSYAHNLTAFQGVNPAILANSKGKQNRIQSQAMNLNVTQSSTSKNIQQHYTSDEATLKKQINFMNIHQPQTFLPFTGVDQPFMMQRPIFSRVPPLIPEKLNDVAHQNLQAALNISSNQMINQLQFKSAKGKLIYDSTYLQNIEMSDQDCRMYVPQVFRKQNGGHINEKPSKYFKHIPKQMIERDKENPVQATNLLVFESRFESGNLSRAHQVADNVYDLELRSDFGSINPMMTQWFYFRVKNTRVNIEYTFNIVNLFKPDSSYTQGMKPLIYSEKQKNLKGQGWYRDGHEIRYFATQHRVKKLGNDQQSYTLSFKIKFPSDNDTVYFSHCFPYTYSDLVRFLNENCNIFSMKDRLKRTQMCRTIAGNSVEMLIITNLESSQDEIAERGAIIVSSRVHPGESNASFIVEGFIKFMMSDDEDAVTLRDRYVFKIVPMLNPDGVIVGNYRSSLGGYDLNRQWQNPSMKVSPEIFCMKEMIKKTLECRKIDLFVDIHGHSRQKNLFIYGCSKLQGGPHTQSTLPYPGSLKKDRIGDLVKNLQSNGNAANTPMFSGIALQNLTTKEKVFPWLFHKNCDDFSYHNCLFGVNKSKESTGRAVVWREFGIINSYTLECSFCGPTQGTLRDCHFTIESLIEMGVQFGRTILEFSNTKVQKVCQGQIESFYKQGGGYIYHGFNGHEKKLKKSEKELAKKMKRIDGQNVLSRQKTPLIKQHSMISPHQNGIGSQIMQLTSNGNYVASQHHQVQSVMNKQKKSVQLETISVKRSEDPVARLINNRNISTAEDKAYHQQLPLEKVRESSVHAILTQYSKGKLIDESKSKLRDRSHKQSTTQRAAIKESYSVQIQGSQDGRDIVTENDGEKAIFQQLTPKQSGQQFKSNLTSMNLILSENGPNISEQQSNQSPKTELLIKKFHSQHDSKKLKSNHRKQRQIAKEQETSTEDKLEQFISSQIALPQDQQSNNKKQINRRNDNHDSLKNIEIEQQQQTPQAYSNEENEIKDSQLQARVNLKSSIHHYSRKQNTLTAENRIVTNVAQDDTSLSRKMANSEHQYFNNGQNKKNLHGINMSALSKLRVSLAQNVNVAEQILTRDFKKTGLSNDPTERHIKLQQIAESQIQHNGPSNQKGNEQQTRNLKSGVSSKKGGKKDKKNQKMLKMGEQFSGKKLSTKSSLHIQQPHLQGQMIQNQQTTQILTTHSQLMKTSGFQSKKQHTGASSTTFKERMHLDNKKTDDEKQFAKAIMAVGSEKHLKYNNLKKQLQKQKEDRIQSNKSSQVINAAAGSTLGNIPSKRQNREQIIEQFTTAINEVIKHDHISMHKKNQTNDYSPLYKDYNRASDFSSSGKKHKKPSSQMKNYTSEAESKKDIPIVIKPTDTLTSLEDLTVTQKKKGMNQNNLSPQPATQTQNKRLRAQKQQLLLLSDKKVASAISGKMSRAGHEASPYKQKRVKAQSDDKYIELDDNSHLQEESLPQRPGHSELTFTSLNETNTNKLIFHKSIDLKPKTNAPIGVSGRNSGAYLQQL